RLAFDAYIIDTVPGEVNQYQTPVFLPVGQRKTIDTKGGTGEWSFALGLNFSNSFHAGLGLGFQQLRYNRTMVHSEFDEYDYNAFKDFSFTEDLEVRGTGFSLKLGMMVRFLDVIRIGGSLHLPTFYRISEEYYNTLYAEYDEALPEFGNQLVHDIKPTDIEGNELSAGTFDYKLNTPLRAMGGASVQIGSSGIVAADVEYVDYSSIRLKESDNVTDFEESNREIENVYRPVLNIRAGGEFRLGNFSIRAGGGYFPSPYDAGELNSDSDYAEFTTGLGYRDGNVFMDLGFAGRVHGEKYNLYWDNTADLDIFKYRLVLSLGIRL
ncbi:MAG: hypothetical protein JXA61_03740, partial [Bacteroidales bacterium]|nr:hypothetical protein [Bacteroidales bacterium]